LKACWISGKLLGMLTTEWLLAKLATAKYGWKLAKFFGLDKMAMRHLLQRSGAVSGFKFRFFESRVALVQTYPTLARRLIEASRVDAMWVSGSKFLSFGRTYRAD
jgi:hypothetical protein